LQQAGIQIERVLLSLLLVLNATSLAPRALRW
jgi:hypothetical protein